MSQDGVSPCASLYVGAVTSDPWPSSCLHIRRWAACIGELNGALVLANARVSAADIPVQPAEQRTGVRSSTHEFITNRSAWTGPCTYNASVRLCECIRKRMLQTFVHTIMWKLVRKTSLDLMCSPAAAAERSPVDGTGAVHPRVQCHTARDTGRHAPHSDIGVRVSDWPGHSHGSCL